ncbi:UNVERIFIED_CONTAM: hypothetical protein PYX00_008642 [Menopon gallinae]|uniref:Peptidase M3A/M3B catalytic domain-containing protein n=1 Tax=Menopon gallinae TaxID=328185 RepID=A0AAW2HNN4_9NEOP
MPTQTYATMKAKWYESRMDKYSLEPIHEACKKYLEKNESNCSEEEKRVLQKYIWHGTMSGLDFNQKEKDRFLEIKQRTKMRIDSYYTKWVNAVISFQQIIRDPKILDDFPADFLRRTAENCEEPERGPWIVSLKDRVYNRFLEYCDYRQSRLHMWLSRRQICSRHGDKRCRADLEVEDIRHMRREYAKLQGYPSFAHLAIKMRMAETLDNVYDMLEGLLEKAKLGQEVEIHAVEQFAFANNFMGQIEMWDLDFWGRLHKKELYNFDERAIQEYFPLGQVLLGLFALCEQLFGIVIEEDNNVKAWHPDVRYFRILDERTKRELGGFFFDPYARKNKRLTDEDSGMCTIFSVGSKVCNTLPAVTLIFDFAPPTEHKPSLLLFKEVENLFFKFGHVLQHVLSDTLYTEASSFINLEPDALRICAKFLRLWLYERGTLESVSGHYNTGEPLPSHILDGICQMREYMAGTKLCEKIYKARLDMELSLDTEFCMPIAKKLWVEHFLFDLKSVDQHPFSLKELFLDSQTCTYYGDVWSDAVAADAFSAFQEAGLRNHEEIALTGRRFRETYFALAGGCRPSEVFRRFRGRDVSVKPLLESLKLNDLQPSIESPEQPKIEPK